MAEVRQQTDQAPEQQFPKSADFKPVKIHVKAGETKYWCRCGLSKKQPFCDGSHKGTNFQPIEWTAEADGDYYFCLCKQTANPPLCDGNHIEAKEKTRERINKCSKAKNHKPNCALCLTCGYFPEIKDLF